VKPILTSIASVAALLGASTLIGNLPVQGDNKDRDRESEIQIGFQISPIPPAKLNLQGKNRALVGLGSYIINAQGGCNDCHTCPSYIPGTNPFPLPFGNGFKGPVMINSVNYMAGGVVFTGPGGATVTSKNITPDATGKPEGLTLEEFKSVIRTGVDPSDKMTLAVMPWPIYQNMTDRDLDAIYAYLSAIPHAEPGNCVAPGQ
jgi:hypothetical protein